MNNKLSRYISGLQIAGAASAISFTVWVAISGLSAVLGLMIVVILAIYGLGLAGGILLWKDLRVGAALSIAHWLLVMPVFAVEQTIAYDLGNILYAELIFVFEDTTEFNLGIQVFALNFTVGNEVRETAVGVDLVAIAVLGYLASHWRELDRLVRVPSSRCASSAVAQQRTSTPDVKGVPDALEHRDEKPS